MRILITKAKNKMDLVNKRMKYIFLKSFPTNLFLLIFLSILLSNSCDAQNFQHLSVENGLLNNSITCITEDAKGFIWIGSEEGLHKYDGQYVIAFTPENSQLKFPFRNITCAFRDSKNRLWFGGNGLVMISKNQQLQII